tara:strand:- start:375 stop:491 length:117 start_codon:yes stop_codon:yes gene_type:complete
MQSVSLPLRQQRAPKWLAQQLFSDSKKLNLNTAKDYST